MIPVQILKGTNLIDWTNCDHHFWAENLAPGCLPEFWAICGWNTIGPRTHCRLSQVSLIKQLNPAFQNKKHRLSIFKHKDSLDSFLEQIFKYHLHLSPSPTSLLHVYIELYVTAPNYWLSHIFYCLFAFKLFQAILLDGNSLRWTMVW